MDRTIAQFNIERFRKLLAGKPDEATRETLISLLAEEAAKQASLSKTPKERAVQR